MDIRINTFWAVAMSFAIPWTIWLFFFLVGCNPTEDGLYTREQQRRDRIRSAEIRRSRGLALYGVAPSEEQKIEEAIASDTPDSPETPPSATAVGPTPTMKLTVVVADTRIFGTTTYEIPDKSTVVFTQAGDGWIAIGFLK